MRIMACVLAIGSVVALSGLDLAYAEDPARLFRIISEVESANGRRSGNMYQITPEYVSDVNRIQRKLTRVDGMKRERFSCESVFDRGASERMMEVYWNYYCPRVGDWSDETKCKLHHVGYRGLRTKKDLAEIYWKKIRTFNKSR